MGENKVVELHVTVGANEIGSLLAALPPITMRLEGPTEIALEVNEGDEWQLVKRKKVLRAPFPLPSFGGGAPSNI
jgi:hypothetical protein